MCRFAVLDSAGVFSGVCDLVQVFRRCFGAEIGDSLLALVILHCGSCGLLKHA